MLVGAAFVGAFLFARLIRAATSMPMTDPQISELGQAIQEVTEKVQLLVREEIALAQAEMTEKVQKLIRGIVAGAIAGIFALFGLIYLLHAFSWGIWELLGTGNGPWLGFLIVTLILFLLGAVGGCWPSASSRRRRRPSPRSPSRRPS